MARNVQRGTPVGQRHQKGFMEINTYFLVLSVFWIQIIYENRINTSLKSPSEATGIQVYLTQRPYFLQHPYSA